MSRNSNKREKCRKINFFSGFFLVLIVVFAVSCKHRPLMVEDVPVPEDTSGNNNNNGNLIPCDSNTVYFSNTILPLFISNCAKPGCHDASSHQEGLILNSYANIM